MSHTRSNTNPSVASGAETETKKKFSTRLKKPLFITTTPQALHNKPTNSTQTTPKIPKFKLSPDYFFGRKEVLHSKPNSTNATPPIPEFKLSPGKEASHSKPANSTKTTPPIPKFEPLHDYFFSGEEVKAEHETNDFAECLEAIKNGINFPNYLINAMLSQQISSLWTPESTPYYKLRQTLEKEKPTEDELKAYRDFLQIKIMAIGSQHAETLSLVVFKLEPIPLRATYHK